MKTSHRPAWARTLLLLLTLLGVPTLSPTAFAVQESSPETETEPAPIEAADPRYESPRAAMMTFLEGINDHLDDELSSDERSSALRDALGAFDFRGITDEPLQREYAIRMLQILNRINLVQPSQLPRDPSRDTFTYFPQRRIVAHGRVSAITDGRIVMSRTETGDWTFSHGTIEAMNGLYRDIERLPERFGEADLPVTLAMRIRGAFPRWAHQPTVFDIEWWQWITIALIVMLGLIIDLMAQVFLRNAWKKIDSRRRVESNTDVVKKAVRPFGMVLSALLWFWSLQLLGLPAGPLGALLVAVRLVVIFACVRAAFRLVDLGGEFLLARAQQTQTKLDDLLVPLMRRTVKILLFAFGVIYIAESLDIEIVPLLTGLGIGGLALGLAAKDSIENFFGSVAVIMDSPFEVGDWVVIGDTEGTVEELGLRSTRVRTFYNSVVSVPNATLVRATIDNYGRRRFRRYTTRVDIRYDTPPDRIDAFCEGVRELVRLHPYTRKDYFHVWMNGFGESGLQVLVYIFFDCPDWGTELRERHRFILDMLRVAERLGVEYAFPTRTIEFTNNDIKPPQELSPSPDRNAELSARRFGVNAARELTGKQPWKDTRPEPVRFDRSASDLAADGPAGEGES